MEDQNQNNSNTNQADTSDTDEPASASPSLDNPKLDLAEEYSNNWKRERADFLNYKKDEAKRMGEFIKFGNEGLVLEILDMLDDLYLAANQMKNTGLDQVIKKFENLLKKYGVERITVGEKFDPKLHEVVEGTEGEKVEEIRAGYTMYGRVIRPARVRLKS